MVRPDDRTFEHAADHFRAQARCFTPPPAPDDALFLQAEALYYDRFELRAPGAHSYAAHLLAAATDFGPFLLLTSASGLLDLRLQSYNGAARLYEGLLVRYPRTRHRPIALYRLSWAYPNVTVSGLPRDREEVLRELRTAPAPWPVLAAEAGRVELRSQDAAMAWSILPGAGQIYTGEVGNGAVRLSLALLSAAALVVPIVYMAKHDELSWQATALSIVGLIGLQISYTTAYQDAQRAVFEHNERAEEAFAATHPLAPCPEGAR